MVLKFMKFPKLGKCIGRCIGLDIPVEIVLRSRNVTTSLFLGKISLSLFSLPLPLSRISNRQPCGRDVYSCW